MRRLLGIFAGLLAAITGTLILMNVVENNTKESEVEAPQLASVLVVREVIPRQTSIDQIGGRVEVVQIPLQFVARGAVASLDAIQSGLVTSTELIPGEQVLSQRFVDPRVQSKIAVPEGLQEVTIAFPVPQAVGGSVTAGDLVGVIGSFAVPATGGNSELGSTTTYLLHKVLVTSVKFSAADATEIEQGLGRIGNVVNRYNSDQLLVTFAVSSMDAARLIFSAEYGRLWLTLEGEAAIVGDEGILNFDDFFPVTGP